MSSNGATMELGFQLNEEQKMMQQMAQEFAANEIVPNQSANDHYNPAN